MHYYGGKKTEEDGTREAKALCKWLIQLFTSTSSGEEEEVSLSMPGQSWDPAAHPRKEGRVMTLDTSDLRRPLIPTESRHRKTGATGNIVSWPCADLPGQLLVLEPGHLPAFLWGCPTPSTLWVVWGLWHGCSWEAHGRCPAVSEGFWWLKSEPVCLGHRWEGCDVTVFPSWSFPSHLSGAFHQF